MAARLPVPCSLNCSHPMPASRRNSMNVGLLVKGLVRDQEHQLLLAEAYSSTVQDMLYHRSDICEAIRQSALQPSSCHGPAPCFGGAGGWHWVSLTPPEPQPLPCDAGDLHLRRQRVESAVAKAQQHREKVSSKPALGISQVCTCPRLFCATAHARGRRRGVDVRTGTGPDESKRIGDGGWFCDSVTECTHTSPLR